MGKEIHRETAGTLKRVSLELGGKSPNIVFADADVEAAVQGALMGVFFNQGQVCCAGTRLFVEQKMHDEFADALAKHAGSIPQGHGLDPSTQIGPLVSKEQLDRVTEGVGRIDGVTRQVAATAEENAAASEELQAQSVTVESAIEQLVAIVGALPPPMGTKRVAARQPRAQRAA